MEVMVVVVVLVVRILSEVVATTRDYYAVKDEARNQFRDARRVFLLGVVVVGLLAYNIVWRSIYF